MPEGRRGFVPPPFPDAVADLVARYDRNREVYESSGYTETGLRRELLDPLFKALGWDVDNSEGTADAYKDVVHEDRLTAAEAPDYAFRVGGARKFFVEAKRPAVKLKRDPRPAYQLRRYSWSAKLPLGIVTTFGEFCVYETRTKPSAADLPPVGRIMYLTYDELPSRWDEIASIFSREAVWKGLFDSYAGTTHGKRGTTEVDAAFLNEMEEWRFDLAKDLAYRNPALTQRELSYVVQATIDRIVFLRICEDRGLERAEGLLDRANERNVYAALLDVFRGADDRYNSGLFHFAEEKGRASAPDGLSLSVTVSDKVLRGIILRLYYPQSPYAFSVISADILGQVYERFLGKHVLVTPGRRVRVEDKPEVRRSGGVYYTPEYVVDYLVEHALLPCLPVEASARAAKGEEPLDSGFTVVDPACGSGSFLIKAYQALLDWHLAQYVQSPVRWSQGKTARVFRDTAGEWRLTTSERKRILLRHIYGVDIDPQAVEVSKLSLLLKVLEGESAESLQQELRLYRERALPDLDMNIKCGNSLVAPDIYRDPSIAGAEAEVTQRLNPFDWSGEFPAAKSAGGFDVVIGNPPYVYRKADDALLEDYFRTHYQAAEGNFELYKFFLEKGLGLLRTGGRLGFIVSATFLVQDTFEKLRRVLLGGSTVERLAPMGPGVFHGVAVDTAIVVARKASPSPDHDVIVQAPVQPRELHRTPEYRIQQSRFVGNPRSAIDYRLDGASANLVQRLRSSFGVLEDGFEFGVGINTGFIRSELTADSCLDERYHPMVVGSGIERYGSVRTQGWIMYDPEYVRSRGDRGRTLPPRRFFEEPKMLVVRTRNLSLKRRIIATIDESGAYNLNRLSNIISRPGYSLVGLLSVLNSALFNWLFAGTYYDYEIKPTYLRTSPLADVNDPGLIASVTLLLDAVGQVKAARTEAERLAATRRRAALEGEVDRNVYRLYALTAEEQATVERYARYVESVEQLVGKRGR